MSSVSNHSFYYCASKGELFGYGCNGNGQLGIGTKEDVVTPMLVMGPKENIRKITSGYSHSAILKENGDLFVFGSFSDGRLGLGDHNEDKCKPVLLMKNVKDVACGGQSTMILDNNNDVYVCGWNSNGQLGFKDLSNIKKPAKLMSGDIKSIHCGYAHSMIYKNNGDLLVFGSNGSGQLGNGTTDTLDTPTMILNDPNIKSISLGRDHSMYLKSNGDAYLFGNVSIKGKQHHTPALLSKNVRSICCGGYYSVFLMDNGDLMGIGANSNRQIDKTGNNKYEEPKLMMNDPSISSVSCGYYHTMVLKKDGELISFGSNSNGQLGTQKTNTSTCTTTKDTSISMLMGEPTRCIWSPESHFSFPSDFRRGILCFLLVLKRIHKKSQQENQKLSTDRKSVV